MQTIETPAFRAHCPPREFSPKDGATVWVPPPAQFQPGGAMRFLALTTSLSRRTEMSAGEQPGCSGHFTESASGDSSCLAENGQSGGLSGSTHSYVRWRTDTSQPFYYTSSQSSSPYAPGCECMSQAGIPPSIVVSSVAGWKRLYQCAILEHDSSKVPQRIAEARHAILNRAEDLKTETAVGETRDFNYALRMLRLLEELAGK